jgi:hypothetical protein
VKPWRSRRLGARPRTAERARPPWLDVARRGAATLITWGDVLPQRWRPSREEQAHEHPHAEDVHQRHEHSARLLGALKLSNAAFKASHHTHQGTRAQGLGFDHGRVVVDDAVPVEVGKDALLARVCRLREATDLDRASILPNRVLLARNSPRARPTRNA